MSQQLKDIVTPHQHDVLCGRGGGTNNHVGNELFRQMVNQKKRSYLNSCKRDKPAVSRAIVQAIRTLDPPGRFLQRDEGTGLWFDIGDQKAREKTSQALREGAPEIRKNMGGNGNGHTVEDNTQAPSPTPPGIPSWHGGHTISHPGGTFPSHHDPFFGGGPPGKLSSDGRGRSTASVSNGSGGFTPPRTSFAAGVPPLGHYYGGPAIPPPFDPYGRQYSMTAAAGAAAAAAAAAGSARGLLHDYSVSARPSIALPPGSAAGPPQTRPDAEASVHSHSSHITPDAAKALMQFLKAQQAKAEADPQAASTFVESRDLATAIAAAAATRGSKEAPPSPGQVSAIAAELEALAQVRSQPKKMPEPPRAGPQAMSHSDLALSIASVTGISPAAATLALQLASKAKENDTTEGSNIKDPEAAASSSLSSARSSIFNPSSAFPAVSNDPYSNLSKRNSTLDSSLGDILNKKSTLIATARGKMNQIADLEPKLDIKNEISKQGNQEDNSSAPASKRGTNGAARSTIASTPEVESRLAVAEQMAELARAGARDTRFSKSTRKSSSLNGEFDDADEAELPVSRKDREFTLIRKRSALFQDLGISGVKIETIQSALAEGKSLYHLLEEARKRPRTVESIKIEDLRVSNPDSEERTTYSQVESSTKEVNDLKAQGEDGSSEGARAEVAKNKSKESPKIEDKTALPAGPQVNGLSPNSESSTRFKPLADQGIKSLVKADNSSESSSQSRGNDTLEQESGKDVVFSKDMVRSALSAIGADIPVS